MKTAAILHSLYVFLEATRKEGKHMVICYADRSGHTQLLWRETDAWLGALDVAQNKAWTAIAFSGPTEDLAMSTADIAAFTQSGKPLYGMSPCGGGSRIILAGGGRPIYIDNKLIGSIGVSGSTLEDDIRLCNVAYTAFMEHY